MHRTVRTLGILAVALPLALGTISTATASAAPASTRATGVTENCFGHQSLALSPKLTDTPQSTTGTATFTLGDADNLLGILGSSNCRSTDNNQTSGTYSGAQMVVNFTALASCYSVTNVNFTGGTITWDDGETDTVGPGPAPITGVDHGDGITDQTATITSGPFKGKTIDIQVQESAMTPNACETNGVGQTSGTGSIEIK